MSEIKRIGAGPRMSKAVVRGNAVYTAGQVAEKTKGGSVADQTREILGLIDDLLAEAGSEKAKILSATIYLSDISTFPEMNSVWDIWVDKANPPARATVEAKLVAPDYKVEIAVIAAK
jgi:enamine deaminase RidA (YjgF/YER057c/UK114 family)